MVRLKTRYILFQIHSESQTAPTPKTIISTLRLSLSKNYGDKGLADSITSFIIKYFSPKTGTGILRCHFDAVENVLGAMFFVQTLDGKNVVLEAIGVSGSISKAERRAIRRNKDMIRRLKNEGRENEVEGLILDMKDENEGELWMFLCSVTYRSIYKKTVKYMDGWIIIYFSLYSTKV